MIEDFARGLLKHVTPSIESLGKTPGHDDRGMPTTVGWIHAPDTGGAFTSKFDFQHGLVVFQLREAVSDPAKLTQAPELIRSPADCKFSAYCCWRSLGDPLDAFALNKKVRDAIVTFDFKDVGNYPRHERTRAIADMFNCTLAVYEIQFAFELTHYTHFDTPEAPPLAAVIVQEGRERTALPLAQPTTSPSIS